MLLMRSGQLTVPASEAAATPTVGVNDAERIRNALTDYLYED